MSASSISPAPSVRTRTVRVDAGELFVKEAGDGPSLLLIHGSGIDADTWGPIFDDLTRDFRVIAYDRRGFSRSTGPATPRWQTHGEDAAAILRELHAAPAAVAGWSAGGIVALQLAIAKPSLVSRLVLLETGLHAVKHLDRVQMRAFLGAQIAARRRGPAAAVDVFMDYTCGFRDGESLWADYPADRKDVLRANAASLLVELRAAGRDRHINRRALSSLKVPVTIAYGERSQRFFESCAKGAAKLMPDATLTTIPEANHALAASAPDATAELIRSAVRAR